MTDFDTSKYLDFMTQDEIDAVVIEAQNNGKDPRKTLGAKYGQAKRRANERLEQAAQNANHAPEEEDDGFSLQTATQAASKDADPQLDLENQKSKSKQAKEHEEAQAVADKQKENAKRVNASRSGQGRATRASEIKDARPSRGKDRVPMHMRNVMTVDTREGYQRRWFNDAEGRIQSALDAGWDFVYKDGMTEVGDSSGTQEGSDIGSRVSKPAGGGITAFLMEIPQALYEEDQLAKQAKVLATEQDMLPDATKEHSDSFYTHNQGGKPITRS